MTNHTHENFTVFFCIECRIRLQLTNVDHMLYCPECDEDIEERNADDVTFIHCTDCDKIIFPVEELDGTTEPDIVYTDGCPTCERIRTETQRHERAVSLLRARYGTTKPQSIKYFFTR